MTIIESEQSRDTSLIEITRGPFILRYSSYRKSEDAKLDLRSEDYIVSELTTDKAMFGLCDGVGSSFYGDIGSQILGETLLKWLGRISIPNNSLLVKNESSNNWLGTLNNDLLAELNNKVNLATNIIQKKEITSKDELIRLAENTQREDFGTQSNFASGILWPRSPTLPNGLILLFWLGNARLRIFNKGKDLTQLLGWGKDPDQLKEVWSSKEGVVGHIYSYITDFSKVSTVIAYSDGLENVEEKIHPNLNKEQLEVIVKRAQSIKDDDVTFLEMSTIPGEVAGITDDIVGLLRSSTPQTSVQTEPELHKLKQAIDTLKKKYDNQSLSIKKTRITLIVLAALLSMSCLLAGLLLGYAWGSLSGPTATPSPSATLTPSLIPSPGESSTFTQTPITPTETITSTLAIPPTESATPTLILIPSGSETLTPSFTNTSTP